MHFSHPSPPTSKRTGDDGFTLVELLVVMAIILLMLAMIVPAFVGAVRSNNLINSVSTVMDQLAFARQTAISRNRTVEVRFYQVTDPSTGKAAYRAIKSYIYTGSGNPQALTRVYSLASLVSLSTGTTSGGNSLSTALKVVSGQLDTLPGSAISVPYCKLVFYPNGRTDLGPPKNNVPWYLTLFTANTAITDTTNNLPANYAVVQIDDYTGRLRLFRP